MERQIIIDIFHPLAVISGSEPVAIYGDETCYTFKYTVHLRIDGNEVCVSISFCPKWQFFLLLCEAVSACTVTEVEHSDGLRDHRPCHRLW